MDGRTYSRKGKTTAAGLLFTLVNASVAVSAPSSELDRPNGTRLVGEWNEWDGSSYADVWAEGNFAYLAHFGDAGVHILDLTDPSHPTEVAHVRADPPNEFASCQDVKVGSGFMFVALEADGNDGVLIVDVRDPRNPVKRAVINIDGFHDVHNLFYDVQHRILYLANSRTPQVAIINMLGYVNNPNTLPSTIRDARWILNNVGNSFVHDITVKDNRLYACAWNSGLWVYNVNEVGRSRPTLLGSTPGQATHSCWPTDDGNYVVTAEERQNGGIKVFRITTLPGPGGALSFSLADEFVFPQEVAFSVHNPLVVGYRVYNAWYGAGLQIFDIDPFNGTLTYVGGYDTFPSDPGMFDGAWGTYPFHGENQVLVSDMDQGLLVVDTTGSAAIELAPGFPERAHPTQATPVRIRIVEQGATVSAGSVKMHFESIGREVSDITMTPMGGGIYAADLPAVPCGAEARFYFSARTADGRSTIVHPKGAPLQRHALVSANAMIEHVRYTFTGIPVGWIVGAPDDDATTGLWVWNNPNGTIAQPDDDFTDVFGADLCFFTGQANPNLPANLNDVDGGKTTLTTPRWDATHPNAGVGYAFWYSNNQGSAPDADEMVIQISNDDGMSWTTLEVVQDSTNSWIPRMFRVQDYIDPTATMRLRFIASDENEPSLVEAAMDELVVVSLVCNQPPGDLDGDGFVNLQDVVNLPECLTGPGLTPLPGCEALDTDLDGAADLFDIRAVVNAFSG